MNRSKNSKAVKPGTMSENISKMAGEFLDAGRSVEERQNRLNAACSAWNMACSTPEVRQRQLEQYAEGYLRFNPNASATDLANIRLDLEKLIERKLKMYPGDKRQVINARVMPVGAEYHIEIASAAIH